MSIRIKLISILLIISMVPIFFLSVIGVQMAAKSLTKEIGDTFETVAIEKSRSIEAILTAKIEETVILASTPSIVESIRKANERYAGISDDAALEEILATDREWISQQGKTQTAFSISTNALSAFFRRYQNRDTGKYGEIFVTDIKGANVAMTKVLSDYYQADESWWKESFYDGKGAVFIDDRGYDESVGSFVVGAVAPVVDGEDVIGIIKINYNLSDVINVVNVDNDEGVVITIARNTGSLVITPDTERPHTTTEPENIIMREGKAGWTTDTHDGIKTIMGYAPISVPIYSRILPAGSKRGVKGEKWHMTVWYTLLDKNYDIAFSPVAKMVRVYLISGFVAIIVVILAALGLARNISRPILRLHKGVKAITEGDFDYHLSIERNDEIGGLARAFTKMTSELSDTMASQKKLTQTIEQSRSLMFITDTSGAIEYANKMFYKVTGYSPEEVLGQTPRIIQSGKTPLPVYEDLWKSINAGEVWHGEIEDRCKDGRLFWADVTITPLRSEDGTIINFSSSHIDITARKEAEIKVLEAKNYAQVANRAKTDLIANMSHELRTPLNAIIGFSEAMKEETFGSVGSDKNRDYLNDIHNSGQHLLELINDILDVSAIEAGAVELNEENISISDVVNASIRIIMPRANDAKVTVTSSVRPETSLINADERRVKQILLNLLSNAVKFTPEGGEVAVNSWLNEDTSLSISVVDTGIGMDEDEVEKALSKFGQVDSGLDRKHEGTGLGLPLTIGLMECHGGTLEVKSERGRGTQIIVTFPKERVA